MRPKIRLRFEDIGLRLADGTTILQGVTGRFHHSAVTAVMGPSGAGKSSLLYALMGTAKFGGCTGRMWINNRPMRLARLRRIFGYVPQVNGTSPHSCTLPVVQTLSSILCRADVRMLVVDPVTSHIPRCPAFFIVMQISTCTRQ